MYPDKHNLHDRQFAPTSGVARWGEVDRITGGRYITINGKEYLCEQIIGGYQLCHLDPETFGFVLYRVLTIGEKWQCSCPDFKYRVREGGCKHVKALRVAIPYIPGGKL
jgi:hypothetical protein